MFLRPTGANANAREVGTLLTEISLHRRSVVCTPVEVVVAFLHLHRSTPPSNPLFQPPFSNPSCHGRKKRRRFALFAVGIHDVRSPLILPLQLSPFLLLFYLPPCFFPLLHCLLFRFILASPVCVELLGMSGVMPGVLGL